MIALLASLALAVAPPPVVLASGPGQVVGVTQAPGKIAWLASDSSGCRVRVRAGGVTRVLSSPRGTCLPPLPAYDLALAGGRAAWGGYVEVRCSEYTAAVHAAGFDQEIAGGCTGYGTAFQGLASDGRSFFYSLLTTRPPGSDSERCGDGGACHWQLAGGRIMRIAGSQAVRVPGLPPAALIAGAPGRLALVPAARTGSSNGEIDWPQAATGGRVEIRDTPTRRLVTGFRPRGTVVAIALSPQSVAVLVRTAQGMRLEWYDAGRGVRLGSVAVSASAAPAISTDGHFIVLSVGTSIRALDVQTRRLRVVRRASVQPVALSVLAGQLVWGEGGRLLAVSL